MGQTISKINGRNYTNLFLLVYLIFHFLILKFQYNISYQLCLLDTGIIGLFIFGMIYTFGVYRNNHVEGFIQIAKLLGENLVAASIYIIIYQIFIELYMTQQVEYVRFLEESKYLRGMIMWVILSNISVVQFIIKYQELEQKEQERTLYNEQLKKDAELFKLRQQINPHFLFNTLNSINALVKMAPDKARNMIQQLSQYFRNTLKKEDHQWIMVAEEVDDIKLYFEIEKVRFGHRLNFQESIDNACLQEKVPPFLLQPLVENAIKYGLYGTTGSITIDFKLYYSYSEVGNRYLTFEIRNPFDKDGSQLSGTGFALQAIRRRLYPLYGRNDLLVTKEKLIENSQFEYTAYLSIPCLQIENNIKYD